MSPLCGSANPWNNTIRCRRYRGHGGPAHKSVNAFGLDIEWAVKHEPMWSPPKPAPVFHMQELAEIYVALSKSPETSKNLVDKVAKLLKEAL